MTLRKKNRVLLFGDNIGIPQLLRQIRSSNIVGIVAAAIRPQYFEELKHLAQQMRVPFLVQPKWQLEFYEDFKQQVAALRVDLIWVNSYSMIIRDDVLALSRLGGLNIHSALLPLNRGCNPIQWAILNGDQETGVTLHEIDAGLDTGPIVDQRKIPLFFGDTWLDVRDRLALATDDLILGNMHRILAGNWIAVPQDETLATTGRRRVPEHSAFKWNEPVVAIYNKIRALLPPLPSAFYYDDEGQKREIVAYQTIWQVASKKYEILRDEGVMQSECVRLRPLRKVDAPLLYEWVTHRELVILNAPFHPVSETDLEVWVESMIFKRSDLVIFVIEESASGNLIGTCQLFNINWCHRSAEMQIFISNTSCRGQGYETQSVQLLTSFGFKDLNLHRIYLHVFATNHSAIRSYEEFGFEQEGELKEAAFIDGEWVNVLVMGLLESHE